ncbi:uncharacterized protein Pyn_39257 [Prunus yedoensis var. nudiflora]|uniref:C2H2-type domain-containing protein n=1 Tax=Prunus yedoensis var. nudiflora TaxID=2094558 RepID=A0A314Y375_PRUYE|nr:uncharacterized protein Pyn_39257 [Prunus yedoensis var. nudiflora]
MFNHYRSSAQSSSTTPKLPITSNTPITPSTDPIPIRFPMSPVLGACLSFQTIQSGDSSKYSCTSCDKVFSTTQALGGHQNAHRKEGMRCLLASNSALPKKMTGTEMSFCLQTL